MSKWAVITGAGQGIGAALTMELSQHGYQVLAVDVCLGPLQSLLNSHTVKDLVHTIEGDVTQQQVIDKVAGYFSEGNNINYFIPCQRVGHLATVRELKMADFEDAFRVHVSSPLCLIQKLIPHLDDGKGRILLPVTPPEAFPQLGWSCYGITKTAFYKLGQQLKMELSDSNISVGTVNPGIVNTEGFCAEVEQMKTASFNAEATLQRIEQAKEHNLLMESSLVAKFMYYLLNEVDDDNFKAKEWSMMDKTHWEQWNN